MRYQKFKPTAVLHPFVECYFVWEGEAKESLDVQSPSNSFNAMVFNYADLYEAYQNSVVRTVVPKAFVCGPFTSNYHLILKGKIGMIGIVFRSSALHNFFGIRMSQLVNNRMPLELLLPGSAYQDMDLDRMLGLCDPNGLISFVPLGDSFKGKIHEVGKGLWSAIMDSFPNLDNTVKNQTFDETINAVTCQVVIFGTQAKEFAGIPDKGNDFDTDHIFIFRFNEEGKINNLTISWDHDGFVKQLTS